MRRYFFRLKDKYKYFAVLSFFCLISIRSALCIFTKLMIRMRFLQVLQSPIYMWYLFFLGSHPSLTDRVFYSLVFRGTAVDRGHLAVIGERGRF